MKKIKITQRVTDKETKELLTPETVIERSEKRAQDFLDRGVAVEIKENTDNQTLADLSKEVEEIDSIDKLDKIAKSEKAGANRKGAFDIIEKRKSEISE